MRTALTAVLLATMVAGVSATDAQSESATGAAVRIASRAGVKIAVMEFTPADRAASMTTNAKRWLHSQLSATLHDTRKFEVYDTRHTRRAAQAMLSAINHDSSTAAAVKIGKQLGVAYVLTGVVAEYTAAGEGGFGYTTLRTRLVDVSTGAVKHSSEIVQKGSAVMRTTSDAEMQSKVMKPAIDALTSALLSTL